MGKTEKSKFMPRNKKKSKKDPNRPKKPMTAFLLFAGSRRGAIREANPGMKVTEISKELGKEWRAMGDKQKKPFSKEAAKLKKAYEKEKAKYDKEKAKNAPPKRPMTAFFLFSKDKRPALREANADLKITEIAKLLGADWRKASEKAKAPYKKKAKTLSDKYRAALEKWKAKQPSEEEEA